MENQRQDTQIYKKALRKALLLLGRRAYSRKEIHDRVATAFNAENARRVVEQLQQWGFVDDPKTAADYCEYWLNMRLWGWKRIAFELTKRGYSDDTIEAMAKRFDEPERQRENLFQLLDKHRNRTAGRSETDLKKRQRLARLAARNGYSWDLFEDAYRCL